MAISSAIGLDRVSRVIGYKIKKGIFGDYLTSNLPQRIAVFGVGNKANEDLPEYKLDPFEFTNAKEVGDKFGYGSPLYMMAKILRPPSGNLIGSVSTVIYPQKVSAGSTTTIVKDLTITNTNPDANTIHSVVIAGRDNVNGEKYSYYVSKTDTAETLKQKIVDAVNSVLGSPVGASIDGTSGEITFETKWVGLIGSDFVIDFDTGDTPAGVIYSEISVTPGSGIADISDSLNAFGNTWNTIVINPYGEGVFEDLEAFNGVPDPIAPTGRYDPIVFKPFVALFGMKESSMADIKAITDDDARKGQVTNVSCPAPNSPAFDFEAAANMAVTTAIIMQDFPHIGNGGRSYYDMPIPVSNDIGDFADYNSRDEIAKSGSSTVTLEGGKYVVQDFFTTYHPTGENPPKFRKVRDLNIDWNIGYGWKIIMERDIQDKTLVSDDVPLRVDQVISPKDAKQLCYSFIVQKAAQALIIDPQFSQKSVEVSVGEQTPNRLDVQFKYKRSSTADLVSTDVEVDFAFSL